MKLHFRNYVNIDFRKIIILILFFFNYLTVFSQDETTVNDYRQIAKSYIDSCNKYFSVNQTLTLKYAYLALENSSLSKNNLLLSESYELFAKIYQKNYQSKKAIDYLNIAVFYALIDNDYNHAKEIIVNIAELHRSIGNYNIGLKMLSNLLNYIDYKNDKLLLAKIFNRNSAIYYEMNEFDKSIENANYSSKISKEIPDSLLIADNMVIMGAAYANLSQFDKALSALTEAEKIYKKYSPQNLPYVLNNMCQTYTLMGNYNKAIDVGLNSYQLALKDSIKPYLRWSTSYLYRAYDKKGDLVNAYKFLNITNYWSEIINLSLERQKFLNEENLKKEKLIKSEILNYQEIIRQNDKINNLRSFIIILLLLFLLLILSFLIAYVYKTNRLKELNDQTLLQKKEISEYAEQLHQVNASKNKFFSIIAHDMRAPFHSILGLTDILHQDYDELSDDDKKEMIEMLYNSSNNIFNLLENLLKWSQTQTGNIQFKPEKIALKPIIENIVNLMQQFALSKNIYLAFHYTDELSVEADRNMIDTVIRNLISNAIKFTENQGSVDVILLQNGDKVKVVVKDNGIGLSKDDIDQIFTLDEKTVSKGTNGENGSGLGLLLCKEFITKNKGEIIINSELGKGSSFAFLLPLAV